VRSKNAKAPSLEVLMSDYMDLETKIKVLEEALAERDQTLEAIQNGEVDAILVSTKSGEQIYTLRGADEPYRILFEQMNEGAVTISETGDILYSNVSFAQVMKTTLGRIIGSNIESQIHHSSRSTFRKMMDRSKSGPVRDELLFETSDGTLIPMQLSISYLMTVDVPTYCLVFTDLTEQIQAKHSLERLNEELETRVHERTNALQKTTDDLRLSEERFRVAFERAPSGICLVGFDSKFIRINDSFASMIGYRKDEMYLIKIEDLLNPNDVEVFHQHTQSLLSGSAKAPRFEMRYIRKNGSFIWSDTSIDLVCDIDKRPLYFVIMVLDISDKRAAEELLLAEREKLSVTLQSIGDGVISTDLDGRITFINDVARELTGSRMNDDIGNPIQEVFQIVDKETRKSLTNPIEKAIELNRITGLEPHTILISKNGREIDIQDSCSPIRDHSGNTMGAVLVFRDVTHEKEEELLEGERFESLGLLAGGIAHDFNNILTIITGNISNLKDRVKDDRIVYNCLEEVEKASERGERLSNSLLTFSKGGKPIKKVISPMKLIMESTKLALSGSNVRVTFSIPSDLWPIEVDEDQLRQAIINLVINAKDAMPRGGDIEIEAGNINRAEGMARRIGGPCIRISVKDHGIGIQKENLDKIFVPFFTTKIKGRGLGLPIVNSVVKKHDGIIEVSSKVGVGTTFTIYLPSSNLVPEIITQKPSEIITGYGRILWMDDEEAIRELAVILLSSLGYEATVTRSGEETIERYREALREGRPFKKVILDLTIPGGMGGRETIKHLQEMDEDVHAIVCSGYSNDETLSEFRELGFAGALSKPFKTSDLATILAENSPS
jgi:two-component system cell cycle sensor histidine kinase/response regulator CckA